MSGSRETQFWEWTHSCMRFAFAELEDDMPRTRPSASSLPAEKVCVLDMPAQMQAPCVEKQFRVELSSSAERVRGTLQLAAAKGIERACSLCAPLPESQGACAADDLSGRFRRTMCDA